MRKIIFRGKRIDNGEWVYGDLFQGVSPHDRQPYSIILTDEKYDAEGHLPKDIALGFHSDEVFIVDANSVGQFTGTYDDTDEEVPIWEGDVLEIIKINDDATSQKIDAVVKWLDIFGGFVVEGINKKGSIALFSQVISDFIVYKKGNIYDNPELLEGGKNE